MTERVELMTYVTCPTVRYHPAVVAQKAATVHALSDGRFTLGLGAGENLNEHVVGEGWPAVDARQDMLVEAIEIIRELLTGELVTYDGDWFRVDSARVWDAPEGGVPIGVAVSGEKSVERFAPLGDHLIAVEPEADLVTGWNAARPDGAATVARDRPDPDLLGPRPRRRRAARARAVPLVRRRLGRQRRPAHPARLRGGQPVRAAGRRRAADPVRSRPRRVVEAVKPYWEAGFTDIALVQVGDEGQQRFLDEAAGPLLEALRSAAPSS